MIVIAGKTASGKTEVAKELEKRGYKRVVTYTTRPQRPNEVDGVDYHFIDKDQFLDMAASSKFAEYQRYIMADGNDVRYGSTFDEYINNTDTKVIILTPQGVRDIKRFGIEPFVIYLYANNTTQKKRLKSRGDNPDEITRRISADNEDFRGFNEECSKIVYNDKNATVPEVVDRILEYYKEWNDRI